VYTTYNQITKNQYGEKGISTGRLSSSEPNLQQIPARTDDGKKLRELFIPEDGKVLIDADYSQIEYRLLAHFTQEPLLLEAFKNGKDVHEETGRALGCDRDTGKTLNFASIYGAQAKKIAKTAKCSEDDAQSFLDLYWKKLPGVTAWVNRIKYEARLKKGITTFMKRFIPLPGIMTNDLYERYHWERAAVNYTIQGSAAEIIKLAMIQLRKKGYLPLLTVHDELLFEVPTMKKDGTEYPFDIEIRSIMESVINISVPLVADVGIGINWREAKGE
jgi:DNA polymerase-1